ncbi:hypothetical protein [Sulfitobacter donghicola]|uniref:Uncharacterized protein n=1 Tax=Sulfitobacter donghicola DSW-25 = KCTC 12864 = JCM 14565 TaxID=1300350 RepID=A0A073IF78_9RHOB|nr:hypothetical protein [Sulfitobacter donghicola]KEJ88225.1 hypothetical protein DSW25_16250 [Sulfitobacter donghicola DSW-25 = KCTC 12864 = JCM 14565]KIN68819.1 hypothetical protein Z948_2551 [Sulfitobacter donghicola DSW-25 = KCTC 12864 = JCM 14565]
MKPEQIEQLFTRGDGQFAFARWGRPIAPNIFGVEDETLKVVKGALEAVAVLADHKMAETDMELGSNLMMFFFSDWAELLDVTGMERLVPDLGPLVARLQAADANQYRFFRFDEDGAIKACFVFLRMDEKLAAMDAQALALSQIVQSYLLWSDTAFRDQSPLAIVGETTILRPDISEVIRAAYDPVLPSAATDPSHALRLFARMQVGADQ